MGTWTRHSHDSALGGQAVKSCCREINIAKVSQPGDASRICWLDSGTH